MSDDVDEGLRLLLERATSAKSVVPIGLVKGCYDILQRNMYEKDQDFALDQIRRLVEAEAAKLATTREGAEA